MRSPEREPFILLGNREQDAVIGINFIPNEFGQSFWIELLQKQVDCDGERQLTLIIANPGKAGEAKIFKDLRKQVQGLSEKERNIFLLGILKQIPLATRILLEEKDKKKDIHPIDKNRPQTQVHRLTAIELQRLIGNIPALDKI